MFFGPRSVYKWLILIKKKQVNESILLILRTNNHFYAIRIHFHQILIFFLYSFRPFILIWSQNELKMTHLMSWWSKLNLVITRELVLLNSVKRIENLWHADLKCLAHWCHIQVHGQFLQEITLNVLKGVLWTQKCV